MTMGSRSSLIAGVCGICAVVILIMWGRHPAVPMPIAVDKHIGHAQKISELGHMETRDANDSLIPFWKLTDKTLDLINLKERLQILPIKCSPGSEGLFPSKYEKLLVSLAEYAAFHREVSDAPQLIWVCDSAHGGCGGLADRLRGIAFSLLLAVFSRRRLLLHWGMPNGEHVFLKPNLINWVTDASSAKNAISVRVMDGQFNAPSAMKAIGNKMAKVAISSNIELEAVKKQIVAPQWLIDGMNRTGVDVLTDIEIKNIFGIAFRYLFQMGRNVSLMVNSTKDRLGLNIHKYVAVHIRTGFVGSAHLEDIRWSKFIKRKHWEQVLMCAVSMANTSVGSNSPIFLATDSKAVKDLAARMYGSRYKTLNFIPVHLDRLDKHSGPKTAADKGILSTWVDFFLLAQSYVLVKAGSYSNSGSGFNIGASQLCGIPRDRRIDGRENCISEDRF